MDNFVALKCGFQNLRHTKGYNDLIYFPTAPIDNFSDQETMEQTNL